MIYNVISAWGSSYQKHNRRLRALNLLLCEPREKFYKLFYIEALLFVAWREYSNSLEN